MPHSRKEIAGRIVFAVLAIGVIVLLASLSGGPAPAAACADGFVYFDGHCVLPQPPDR